MQGIYTLKNLNKNFISNILKNIENMKTIEELLAVEWSIDYIIPLSHLDRYNWHLVIYENLLKEPENTIVSIFDHINEDIPSSVYKLFERPSSTSKEKEIKISKQLIKWKKQLTKEKIKRILDIIYFLVLIFMEKKLT